MNSGKWYFQYSYADPDSLGYCIKYKAFPLRSLTEEKAILEGELEWKCLVKEATESWEQRQTEKFPPKTVFEYGPWSPCVVYKIIVGDQHYERLNMEGWHHLWGRMEARGNAQEIYNDLVTRYAEPHRAYHTIEHIKHCLYEFEQVRRLAEWPDDIELAIWYHDAIYDTKSKDNEEKSASLAREMLRNASKNDVVGRFVTRLILATKHSVIPDNYDAELLADIDLSILGQPEGRYDEYERQIRKEYQDVSDEDFLRGRVKILRSFLERRSIYWTGFFRDKYEERARKNIIRWYPNL